MNLEEYYNKFNEDKRLLSRHGQVEMYVTMHYIHKYLKNNKNLRILDVGAGSGRYSIALKKEGYYVEAVELCSSNVGKIKVNQKKENISFPFYQGSALDLSRYEDESFDVILLLGPMYHLHGDDNKIKALKEAQRVCKKNGVIFVAYCMNEYCVISYAFMDKNILECIENDKIDLDNFHCKLVEQDLYDYVRVEDIARINARTTLIEDDLIVVDGPTDYIRNKINALSDEEFELYKKYILSISARKDILGASSHTLNILIKK